MHPQRLTSAFILFSQEDVKTSFKFPFLMSLTMPGNANRALPTPLSILKRGALRVRRLYWHWRNKLSHFAQYESRKLLLVIAGLFFAGIMIGFSVFTGWQEDQAAARVMSLPHMTLQELKKAVTHDKITTIIADTVKTGGFFEGVQYHSFLEVVPLHGPHMVVEQAGQMGEELWKELAQSAFVHPVKFEQGHNALRNVPAVAFMATGVTLLALIAVLVMAQMLMGEMLSGYNFRPDRPDGNITLDSVIGYPNEKREIVELLAQLEAAKDQEPGKGPRVPRGLLLSGDPGTGKTMMARAIAGSLKAEFFTCTGADFVEMYVGVGPKRVRALFRQARHASSAVIFIDEIDALGSRDNQGMDSERMATINRMLAEMDGMNGKGNFLVIGATNHPDRLDAALRRPGRFDRQIHIPLPDIETRVGILAKYLEGVPADKTIDLQALALRTRGYSGAHLRQVVEEAQKLAKREGASETATVTQDHMERGQEVALLGVGERRSTGDEAYRAGVHELGHALVGHLRCPNSHVEKVTIIGRGQALGYTLSRPSNENMLETEANLHGQLAMMLGGRAAEQVMLKSVSSGASDDLERANQLARKMVGQLGMGQRFGLRTVIATRDGEWPEIAEADVADLLAVAYTQAQAVVAKHETWMSDRIAQLLNHGTLDREVLFGDGWDGTGISQGQLDLREGATV